MKGSVDVEKMEVAWHYRPPPSISVAALRAWTATRDIICPPIATPVHLTMKIPQYARQLGHIPKKDLNFAGLKMSGELIMDDLRARSLFNLCTRGV